MIKNLIKCAYTISLSNSSEFQHQSFVIRNEKHRSVASKRVILEYFNGPSPIFTGLSVSTVANFETEIKHYTRNNLRRWEFYENFHLIRSRRSSYAINT